MNNKIKLFSLLMVLSILCRGFWPVPELPSRFAADQIFSEELTSEDPIGAPVMWIGQRMENHESMQVQFTSAGYFSADELCMPELTGNRAAAVTIGNSFYVNSFRGRTVFGRLLFLFWLLEAVLEASFCFSFFWFQDFCGLQNLSDILMFIHDKDGKKRLL